MSTSRDLVLGTAFGYRRQQVQAFVESLRRHFDGEVMMLVTSRNSGDLVKYLHSKNVQPVPFEAPYWSFVHVQLGRYIRYLELLLGSAHQYSRILLTDVSDVIFQGHPFATAPPGELLCFLEDPAWLIGKSKVNAQWIEEIYGPAELDTLRDKPVSCSGTTIGSHAAIVNYLELLLSHASPQVMLNLTNGRGHDQGIHNYLLHKGLLKSAVIVPNGQHVFTMGVVPDAEFAVNDGIITTRAGQIPPIVHQYNYNPAALQQVLQKFGLQ